VIHSWQQANWEEKTSRGDCWGEMSRDKFSNGGNAWLGVVPGKYEEMSRGGRGEF